MTRVTVVLGMPDMINFYRLVTQTSHVCNNQSFLAEKLFFFLI